MRNKLDYYGITAELLGKETYERAVRPERAPTLDDIAALVDCLSPGQGGHALLRIGGTDGDGSYLLPNDLAGIESCFSPGVNNFKDFEDDLARHHGIKSYMCDFSSELHLFRSPLIDGMQFFEKKWLDPKPGKNNLDINTWVDGGLSAGGEAILQMDIEGAEFRNLLHATPDTLQRFRIIVLELHHLLFLSDASYLWGVIGPTIEKLSRHFACVHAHPNNCCGTIAFGQTVVPNVIELTFLRRDRLKPSDHKLVLPHPLDVLNEPQTAPIYLSGRWLQHADPVESRLSAMSHSLMWAEKQIRQRDVKIRRLGAKIMQFTENIAREKPAMQSSLSQWSTPLGAQGGNNGIKTGAFGFHTNEEQDPWWMVDLGADCAISIVALFNRLDTCWDRSRTVQVSLSRDKIKWDLVYDHQGRLPFGGIQLLNGIPPLVVTLDDNVARYIKIGCVGLTALHLDEVEVYGSPIIHECECG